MGVRCPGWLARRWCPLAPPPHLPRNRLDTGVRETHGPAYLTIAKMTTRPMTNAVMARRLYMMMPPECLVRVPLSRVQKWMIGRVTVVKFIC